MGFLISVEQMLVPVHVSLVPVHVSLTSVPTVNVVSSSLRIRSELAWPSNRFSQHDIDTGYPGQRPS